MTSMLIGNVLSYGTYFYFYKFFKTLFNVDDDNVFGIMKVGYLAGLIGTLITNPFWVINAKMTLDKNN